MPYKDEAKRKEANRLAMEKKRKGYTDGVHIEGVHSDKTAGTLLHRPNGADYDPTERLYGNPCYADGALRYLGPMTDGQCLDRLTVGGV